MDAVVQRELRQMANDVLADRLSRGRVVHGEDLHVTLTKEGVDVAIGDHFRKRLAAVVLIDLDRLQQLRRGGRAVCAGLSG